MIKLERERSAKAITSSLRGKSRIEKALLLLEATRNNNLKFTSKNSYWKNAKKQLKKEANEKCAYCEAATAVVAHGDVEHFRPKSIYWWLAYCYDNYLFSCQICNQSYKGDSFPIFGILMQLTPPLPAPFPNNLTNDDLSKIAAMFAPDPLNDAEGYPMTNFRQAALNEEAGLVDPYLEDPEPYFKWEADSVLKEVSIKAQDNTTRAKRAYEAVDKYYGLNREELKRLRWKTYEILETMKDALLEFESQGTNVALRNQIKDQIKKMMAASSPFAGMARYFVGEWNLTL
jgi:hypothetical protein